MQPALQSGDYDLAVQTAAENLGTVLAEQVPQTAKAKESMMPLQDLRRLWIDNVVPLLFFIVVGILLAQTTSILVTDLIASRR